MVFSASMRFTELLSRLTGFSTPIFGVSWNPPQADIAVAKRVITVLEDRRVLYDPTDVEVAEHCISSVLQIRQFLTQVLVDKNESDGLADHLRAMRFACRKFLDMVGVPADQREFLFSHHQGFRNGLHDWRLNQALGELRATFGVHIVHIAVKYGLDVEDQLAVILPEPSTSDEQVENI